MAHFPLAAPPGRKGGETELEGGSFVYVAPEEEHNFVNTGAAPFVFLCAIPAKKSYVK